MLFQEAFSFSPRALRANAHPIALLAVGLVLATMTAVAAAAHALVAALPWAVAGSFSLWQAGLRFVAGAVGGVAIGLAVGWLIAEACAGSRTRWSRSCCRW